MAPPIQRTPFIAEQFFAQDDDGNTYTVCHWMWRLTVTLASGETAATTTGWKYETTDGKHVNPVGGGAFELAEDRRRLTRE